MSTPVPGRRWSSQLNKLQLKLREVRSPEFRHKHCHILVKNLLIQAITRIIDYRTYGFIITFSEIPNAFLNESGSVRITICFEQNIHSYTPGYVKAIMRISFPHAYHDSSGDTMHLDIVFSVAWTSSIFIT